MSELERGIAAWDAELEIRARGRRLRGSFPYGKLATRRDRGRTRKETFHPLAFAFTIDDDEREIHLLSGHDLGKPLASKLAGSLEIEDTPEAVTFEARLPPRAEQPSWMRDTVLAIEQGLATGLSPGFRVPPASVVPDAERLIPEPGNSGVLIRQIRAALLTEFSIVTRPVYTEAGVELRHDARTVAPRLRVFL